MSKVYTRGLCGPLVESLAMRAGCRVSGRRRPRGRTPGYHAAHRGRLHPAPIPRIVDVVARCIEMDSSDNTLDSVRPAAVAGLFYPGASAVLARDVDDWLPRGR